MPGEDELFYRQAMQRIQVLTAGLAVVGAAGFFWMAGWPGGMGFLLGAVASWLNFWWLKRIAEALGESGAKPRSGAAIFLGLRYLVLIAAGYVIVNYFGISLMAALSGLLTAVMAVILEILYELIYART